MALLKTNYKDDILLDTSGKRKYTMITNDDGTVSFVDVTDYSQNGDAFGAADINATNTEVNEHFASVDKSLEELNTKIEKNSLEFKLIHSGGSVLNLTDEQIQDYHEFFVIVSYSDVGSGNCLIFDKMTKNSNNHVYSSIGRFTTSGYWFSGYVKLNLNENQLSYGQSYASGGSFSRMEVYAR